MDRNDLVKSTENVNHYLRELITDLHDYGQERGLTEASLEGVIKFRESFDSAFLKQTINSAESISKSLFSLKFTVTSLK